MEHEMHRKYEESSGNDDKVMEIKLDNMRLTLEKEDENSWSGFLNSPIKKRIEMLKEKK